MEVASQEGASQEVRPWDRLSAWREAASQEVGLWNWMTVGREPA